MGDEGVGVVQPWQNVTGGVWPSEAVRERKEGSFGEKKTSKA